MRLFRGIRYALRKRLTVRMSNVHPHGPTRRGWCPVQKIRANNSSAENISGFAVVDEIAVQHGAVSGLAIGPDGKLIVTH
jgi:hypothetical protein